VAAIKGAASDSVSRISVLHFGHAMVGSFILAFPVSFDMNGIVTGPPAARPSSIAGVR
jgi:hypothetical protein